MHTWFLLVPFSSMLPLCYAAPPPPLVNSLSYNGSGLLMLPSQAAPSMTKIYLVVLRSSVFSIAAVVWRSGTSSSASSSPTRTTPGRAWSRRHRSLRWCPRASSTATSSSRPSFSTESWKCRPPLSDSTTSKTFQRKTFPRKKHFLHFETLVFCHIYQILSSSVSLLRKPNVCELCILFLRRWTQPAKKIRVSALLLGCGTIDFSEI